VDSLIIQSLKHLRAKRGGAGVIAKHSVIVGLVMQTGPICHGEKPVSFVMLRDDLQLPLNSLRSSTLPSSPLISTVILGGLFLKVSRM